MRLMMFVAAVAALTAGPAHAADQAVIPWGDWVADAAVTMLGVAGAAAAFALRQAPAHLRWILIAIRAEQLLERAITFGINRVAGAARGRTLTVDLGHRVANAALEYATTHAMRLVTELGGVVRLREMILARLDLEPDATIDAPAQPLTR